MVEKAATAIDPGDIFLASVTTHFSASASFLLMPTRTAFRQPAQHSRENELVTGET